MALIKLIKFLIFQNFLKLQLLHTHTNAHEYIHTKHNKSLRINKNKIVSKLKNSKKKELKLK